MSSRIEQIIDEIDEFIESCKFQPLSATKDHCKQRRNRRTFKRTPPENTGRD